MFFMLFTVQVARPLPVATITARPIERSLQNAQPAGIVLKLYLLIEKLI